LKILIADGLSPEAIEMLRAKHHVDVLDAGSRPRLPEIVGEYDALIVRSQTKVTAELLVRAQRLKVVARAGIGVDNIDVEEATRRGIAVANAPNGNVTAAAEHTLAMMLALARQIPRADAAVRAGRFPRASLEGVELGGKTLGIVGLGKIGCAVAERARALGMKVLGHDPYVGQGRAAQFGVQLTSLEDLLRTSDWITVHVPGQASTRRLIGGSELALVKPSCRIINCARGGVVDETALMDALEGGRVAGAALDVFEGEPVVSERLRKCEQVVLTPHIAGSTQESRDRIGVEVATEILAALDGRPLVHPVNLPALTPADWEAIAPFLTLVRRMAAIGIALFDEPVRTVTVESAEILPDASRSVLTSAAVQSLLSRLHTGEVNLVNARCLAEAQGLVVEDAVRSSGHDAEPEVLLRLASGSASWEILGTVSRGAAQVLRVNDYWLGFPAAGTLLLSEHREGAGIVGSVGGILGHAGLSISFMQLSRVARGGQGMMVVGLDEDGVGAEALFALRALPSVRWIRVVALPAEGSGETS
jgi:D-3-phosphoglycerate dehydrogenase